MALLFRSWLLLAVVLLVGTVCVANAAVIPIRVYATSSDATFTMGDVDILSRNDDPARFPMFKDLVGRGGPRDSFTVSEKELRAALAEAQATPGKPLFGDKIKSRTGVDDCVLTGGCDMPGEQPSGFVFHESRCGSTLVANMLSGVEKAIVYSESSAPADVINHCADCSRERQISLLRLTIAVMIRYPGAAKSFFKFQSVNSLSVDLVLEAFPDVPWLFLYRDGAEVLVSNFRGGFAGPCGRQQMHAPPIVQTFTGKSRSELARLTNVEYCGAHIGTIRAGMLDALKMSSVGTPLPYTHIKTLLTSVLTDRFHVPLSASEMDRISALAAPYSKSRRRADKSAFKGDSAKKQAKASDDIVRVASDVLTPLEEKLNKAALDLGLPVDRALQATAPKQPEPLSPPDIPYPENYPQQFPFQDILKAWNPDDITVPDTYPQYNSLKYFDYQTELAEALMYRSLELPFIIRNIPNLHEVGELWTDEYLTEQSKTISIRTETAASNHFMYHNGHTRSGKLPTQSVPMNYAQWSRRADAKEKKLDNGEPLFYMRMSGYPASGDFIGKDLSMYSPPSFFVKQPENQRGIHCRFGMPSIIAESHYDGGRNFIAMIRGSKRYVLNAPDQCSKLSMLKSGMSARHASFDWSDPANFAKFGDATGLEVVLTAGDVLYVPAFWFHYIVSLEKNVQCNTRSGTPAVDADAIKDCGFGVRVNDPAVTSRSMDTGKREWMRSAPSVKDLVGDRMLSVPAASTTGNGNNAHPLGLTLFQRIRTGDASHQAARSTGSTSPSVPSYGVSVSLVLLLATLVGGLVIAYRAWTRVSGGGGSTPQRLSARR